MPLTDKAFFYNLTLLSINALIYILCYWGQEITDEGRSVASECLNADFVSLEISIQKQLLLISHAAQNCKYLIGGKLVPMSLDTIVAVSVFTKLMFFFLHNFVLFSAEQGILFILQCAAGHKWEWKVKQWFY